MELGRDKTASHRTSPIWAHPGLALQVASGCRLSHHLPAECLCPGNAGECSRVLLQTKLGFYPPAMAQRGQVRSLSPWGGQSASRAALWLSSLNAFRVPLRQGPSEVPAGHPGGRTLLAPPPPWQETTAASAYRWSSRNECSCHVLSLEGTAKTYERKRGGPFAQRKAEAPPPPPPPPAPVFV